MHDPRDGLPQSSGIAERTANYGPLLFDGSTLASKFYLKMTCPWCTFLRSLVSPYRMRHRNQRFFIYDIWGGFGQLGKLEHLSDFQA